MIEIAAKTPDGRSCEITITPQNNLSNMRIKIGPVLVGDQMLSRDVFKRVAVNFGTIPRDYTPMRADAGPPHQRGCGDSPSDGSTHHPARPSSEKDCGPARPAARSALKKASRVRVTVPAINPLSPFIPNPYLVPTPTPMSPFTFPEAPIPPTTYDTNPG